MKVPVAVSEMQHEYKKEGVNVCMWGVYGLRTEFASCSQKHPDHCHILPLCEVPVVRVLTRFDSSWSCSLRCFFSRVFFRPRVFLGKIPLPISKSKLPHHRFPSDSNSISTLISWVWRWRRANTLSSPFPCPHHQADRQGRWILTGHGQRLTWREGRKA